MRQKGMRKIWQRIYRWISIQEGVVMKDELEEGVMMDGEVFE